ncbi:MAG: hypothetical protein WAM62_01435 [Pseudolabrys sp.]
MRSLVTMALASAILLAAVHVVDAKTERSSGSGGFHSSGSHTGGSHRNASPRPHAAKSKSNYVIVKCKTKACLKKHPSGVYGFVPKAKQGR